MEARSDSVASMGSSSDIERRILPILIVAWFVAYLDRFNISFAALQMNTALGLSQAAFGFGAGVFFLGYSLFELPSNLILTKVGPRRWLGRIMISWGVISIALTGVRGPTGFYILRFLLGVAEAGCFPGIAFYISQWLPLQARPRALAKIGSVSQISGLLGGPIAAACFLLTGHWGLAGWQWLFIVEGVPAILVGWYVLRFLPDPPTGTSQLRSLAGQRLDSRPTATLLNGVYVIKQVMSAPQYWIWALIFLSFNTSGSVLRLWQPLILKQLSSATDLVISLLSSVPAITGTLAILIAGYSSSRLNERRLHVALPMVAGGVGLFFVGMTTSVAGSLAAASCATAAVACQPPLFASVSAASSDAPTNAAGIAFVNSVAMIGAFVGPYVLGLIVDASGDYRVGCAVFAALLVLGGLLALSIKERGESIAIATIRQHA